MASRPSKIEPRRPAPRLYLVTPPVSDPAAIKDSLAAAIGAGDVAAVMLRLAATDERTLINHAKTLAPIVQDKGTALLIHGHAGIVVRAGADGVHADGIAEFERAAAFKPERIVGCGGLLTRHDAMSAAEGGADYVMFGEPDAEGHRPSFEAILERIGWWAEVFEIPCVGLAETPAEAEELAATGADFVALGSVVFDDPRGPAVAAAEAARRLAAVEVAG